MAGKKKRREPSNFLDEWSRKERHRISDLSKETIHADKYDRQDYARLLREAELLDFAAAEDRITDVIETGGTMFADAYYSLAKADPKMLEPGEIRPSHMINRTVMEQSFDLAEYTELREYSVGDDIGAALACIAMEPEYETLYDRLKQERKLAEELKKQEDQIEQLEREIDEMMKDLEDDGEGEGDGDGKGQNFQERQDLLNQLREQLAEGAQELEAKLDQRGPDIKATMKGIANKGLDEMKDGEVSAAAWGLERGHLQKLDPKKRMELAARLRNPRLKRIAELIGPMQRLAFAEQIRKVNQSREEVYDLEIGNDLERVVASEFGNLADEDTEMLFYEKFIDGRLLQYKLRGEERVAKGGIILCEDGSGSMHGEPEQWSKAVSGCLLQISKQQNRSFYGIHFGGPRELYQKDFRDPKNVHFEDVLEWMEVFFGGGTDFVTPLQRALELLQEEFKEKGAVEGDIVFITDGYCGVPDEWLQMFKEEQKRIDFRVFGIVIGGSAQSEPLRTICDGRVLTVKDLKSGEDLRDVFRRL